MEFILYLHVCPFFAAILLFCSLTSSIYFAHYCSHLGSDEVHTSINIRFLVSHSCTGWQQENTCFLHDDEMAIFVSSKIEQDKKLISQNKQVN